jgi:hypothetical protein
MKRTLIPEEARQVIPPFPVTVDTEVIDMATGSVAEAHSTASPSMTWCVRGGR